MFRPLLVPFVVLAGWIGLGYVLGDPVRTSTPSFESARELAPIPVWGAMFLIGAATLVVSMFLSDFLMRCALFVGGVIYSWWAALFAITALQDDKASLNAPAIYAFLAFCHYIAASPDLFHRLRKGTL